MVLFNPWVKVSASFDHKYGVGIAQEAVMNLVWNEDFRQPTHFSDSKFLGTDNYIKRVV